MVGTDGVPKGHVSQIPPAHADGSVAHSVPEVVLGDHGGGFVGDGARYALSWFGRVVSNGGWSTAQVGVGGARVRCRLFSCCLLGAGCSGLPLLIDEAGFSSLLRAEVVDGDDTVKQ